MSTKQTPKPKTLRDTLRETGEVQRKLSPSVTFSKREPGREPSLVASAKRLTQEDRTSRNKKTIAGAGDAAPWQTEAWELLDLLGEVYFLMNTLSGRTGQAALYVGKTQPLADASDSPEFVDDESVQQILDALGDGAAGLSQILYRLAANLFVVGEGWVIGIPPYLVKGTSEYELAQEIRRSAGLGGSRRLPEIDRIDLGSSEGISEEDVQRMVWRSFSISEVNVDSDGGVKLIMEDGSTIESSEDDLYMIRIWKSHPDRAWEATSSIRSSMPVLRELVGLTMHVSAQIDSRLAGAGVLVVSTEASASLKRAAGLSESSTEDPLLEALMEAMVTPITNRESASAVVPMIISVPGSEVDNVKHITFSTPLDKEAPKHRDEAIRRLAIGLDAPPELLLGSGGMNHWGAWLVREETVKAHLEPSLALICSALTTEYLRPILLSRGMSPEEVAKYQVWYDVSHLIEQPNREATAKSLFDVGAISDTSLREASGFSENDAPPQAVGESDRAADLAFDMVGKAPSLIQSPGLPQLVEQIRAVISGSGAIPSDSESTSEEGEGGGTPALPNTSRESAPPGTPANPSGGGQ